MRLLLLIFLACFSCERCPKKAPPFTWHPLLSDEQLYSRGKWRKRPLYKAKVPINWIRDPELSMLTYKVSNGVTLTVTRNSDDCNTPMIGEPISKREFEGTFWREEGSSLQYLLWTLKPIDSVVRGLISPGQNEEEEIFFKQMSALVQIEVSGPREEIEEHREEILTFLDSFTFIQGVPSA